MAKGFTVKAKAPTKDNGPEWDIPAIIWVSILRMMRKKSEKSVKKKPLINQRFVDKKC